MIQEGVVAMLGFAFVQSVQRVPDSSGAYISYFALFFCPVCESTQNNGERIPIAQLWGEDRDEDPERTLREALLKAGPWICRRCGIPFYLNWTSIDAVVAVQLRAHIVEDAIRSDKTLHDMREVSFDEAQRGEIFIPVEELRRREPNV